MKDQYFGDINDYRKYGLLRAIESATGFRMLIAWMLTPDDGSGDGQKISYLESPDKWSRYDPELFSGLRNLLASSNRRQVGLFERSDLLPNVQFFSTHVPDSAGLRESWFNALIKVSAGEEFLFLDPDNGIEVKSRKYGNKNSSKYVYWREIEVLWNSGLSLLIYQHFPYEKRIGFVQRMMDALGIATKGSLVEAFSTSNVLFLMALQPPHHCQHRAITDAVQERWAGQIHHWELLPDPVKTGM